MLQVVEFTFILCDAAYPSEIGFTQEVLPNSYCHAKWCQHFNDEGMKGLSSAQFLERHELVDCQRITDAGISFILRAPSLISLTLRQCEKVTDGGMAQLRSQKLQSLTVVGYRRISLKGVQGAASSVCYSHELESQTCLKGLKRVDLTQDFGCC
ncbi:hypothetical protein EJB05_19389, partial [Eragrostis curvula]